MYNFVNAILFEGYGKPDIAAEKTDRGELPGNAWGKRRIAITKTDVVKDTAFLAIVSSGDMEEDRLVKIDDSFRTNSLNRDARKRDHDDFVDVALGAYLCSYEATGSIVLMSPRSVTRAAAIAVAILLYSTPGLTAQEAVYRVCACLSNVDDCSGLAVYSCVLVAIEQRVTGFKESQFIREQNIILDTTPRQADLERDEDTQIDSFGFDDDGDNVDPRCFTRADGYRDQIISDLGLHDIVVWQAPTNNDNKTRQGTAIRGKKRAAKKDAEKKKRPAKKKKTTAAEVRRKLDKMEHGTKITRCFRVGEGTASEHLSWEEATFERVQVGRHTSLYIKAKDLVFKYGDTEWGHSRASLTGKTLEEDSLLFEAKVKDGWFWGHCADELQGRGEEL